MDMQLTKYRLLKKALPPPTVLLRTLFVKVVVEYVLVDFLTCHVFFYPLYPYKIHSFLYFVCLLSK